MSCLAQQEMMITQWLTEGRDYSDVDAQHLGFPAKIESQIQIHAEYLQCWYCVEYFLFLLVTKQNLAVSSVSLGVLLDWLLLVSKFSPTINIY